MLAPSPHARLDMEGVDCAEEAETRMLKMRVRDVRLYVNGLSWPDRRFARSRIMADGV